MPEQDPSRFESLKQGAKEALQSVLDFGERKLAIGLIGAVGIAGGGVAVANQLSTESASAANVPEATASDQTQGCVDEALNGLKIKKGNYTTMTYPGDRIRQITGTSAILAPVSPDCLPLVNRETPKVSFKIQRPKNHKAYIRTKSQPMTDMGWNIIDGNKGGVGGTTVTANGKGGMKATNFRYRCTPGKSTTHVKAVYEVKIKSPVDGHKLGQKTFTAPVKILPVSGIILGGGVRKAC